MFSKLKTIVIAFLTLLLTLAIVSFPEQVLIASVHGLKVWWEIVFPSLLPFFIMAELLTSFGIVQFFGVLFEPVMRPLFNVRGVGSFAWILGMVSGFPSGAKITVLLRKKNEISRIEAERLLSFSNASSPLFIFGAIAVGFFQNVKLGVIIALNHYISNFLVGLIMKHYGRNKDEKRKKETFSFHRVFNRAFARMHRTRISETRPLGELVGDAVISSIQTLLMIGGFIILFSVFTSLLSATPFMFFVEFMFAPILHFFGIPSEVIPAFITGLFEITMGAEAISKVTSIPLVGQLMLISFILGFNGFSIQAQVASLIAKTDIRFYPFFFARLLHASLASFFTYVTYKLYFDQRMDIVDAMNPMLTFPQFVLVFVDFVKHYGPIITISSIGFGVLLLLRRIKA